jgi:predicted Rossmann fold flavoprotein
MLKLRDFKQSYDVIIIGAGAAGLMCAIEAGKRGKKTLLIDSAESVGKKIRISGGGRCNFTNMEINTDNFLSQNLAFCISALKRFSQHDFIALVKKHNIAYHHKTLGQLFCDGSSQQIIDMLLDECQEHNVEILLQTEVNKISKNGDHFSLSINKDTLQSKSLVIATGGLSIPKMGATDFGYKIARDFGIKIIQPTPALVPLTFDHITLEETQSLSGVAVEIIVNIGKRQFQENLLFTHRGLSGPAILQISSYWQKGVAININLAPKTNVFAWLQNEKQSKPKQEIKTILANILPKKLAIYLLEQNNIAGSLADLSNKKLQQIAANINNWQITPNGSEGFAKAEVTLGGVDTNEISSQKFESKKIPNLYFIGEVLDVTGHLGGYNFQWAWSSGYAAGQFA